MFINNKNDYEIWDLFLYLEPQRDRQTGMQADRHTHRHTTYKCTVHQ